MKNSSPYDMEADMVELDEDENQEIRFSDEMGSPLVGDLPDLSQSIQKTKCK